MRRRTGATLPPPELMTPPPIPTGVDPVEALLAWRAAYDQWRTDRAAWVAVGGEWPGGEEQRELQEAMAMPDEPFDPAVDL